jgi:hypothetical protein
VTGSCRSKLIIAEDPNECRAEKAWKFRNSFITVRYYFCPWVAGRYIQCEIMKWINI